MKNNSFYFALGEECRDDKGFILERDFVKKLKENGEDESTLSLLIIRGVVKRFVMDLATYRSFGYGLYLREVDGVVKFRKGGIKNRGFLSFSPFNELKLGGCYECI